MASVSEHYERHLGEIYSWMSGDFDVAVQSAIDEFRLIRLIPSTAAIAIDLGCGHGVHSVALARMGYSVVGFDLCGRLLDQFRVRTNPQSVQCVQADLRFFRNHVAQTVDAIVCMGDTLTHLATESEVADLISHVALAVRSGGIFATSFRDYSLAPLEGVARFVPVRSDPDRILTCFLEYGERTVTVTDVLHDQAEGSWAMRVSSYEKIRLSPELVAKMLSQAGFKSRVEPSSRGMVGVVGVKA